MRFTWTRLYFIHLYAFKCIMVLRPLGLGSCEHDYDGLQKKKSMSYLNAIFWRISQSGFIIHTRRPQMYGFLSFTKQTTNSLNWITLVWTNEHNCMLSPRLNSRHVASQKNNLQNFTEFSPERSITLFRLLLQRNCRFKCSWLNLVHINIALYFSINVLQIDIGSSQQFSGFCLKK